MQKKRKLWTEVGRAELEKLELLPYAAERRTQLLQALDGLDAEIEQLNRRGGSGSGPVTGGGDRVANASRSGTGNGAGHGADAGAGGAVSLGQGSGKLLWIDSWRVFQRQGQQKLGHISKQGSSFLRVLLVEAGQTAARYDAELGRYRRLAVQQTSRPGQSGGGAQAGSEVVPDVARGLDVRAIVGRSCRRALSHPVVERQNRPLE